MILPTLYGATTDFTGATTIGVEPRVTITADITLLAGQAGVVTGAIRGASPVSPKSYGIEAVPEILAPQWWREALSRGRANDEVGGFAFRDMAPGLYRLVARRLGAKWSPQDGELLALGTAVVAAGQHVVVDLPLGSGLVVNGTVECANLSQTSGVPRAIDLRGTGDIGSLRASVPLEVEGQFQIGGLIPGRYIVSLAGPQGAIRLTQPDVVVDATDLSGVRLRCAPRPGTLSGMVVNAKGTPLVDVVVVALLADSAATMSQRVRVVRPDSRGRFELSDVQWRELFVGLAILPELLADSAQVVERVRATGLACSWPQVSSGHLP
jgi:hypothetical protein